ncbi:MAG: 2-oxo acid dehydrogenase subunit E2 [Dethiobacter sp.]|jgi:pyruvate dehydrogenase E2 component (dihydrolipoamide acetyltransferase)|nr:2-oxo acid dehydrogenase subunit E2 [Dethiobacter sp.]
MPVNVTMPKSGMTMTEGVIARWHKKEGQAVKKGELLAEILTDKVTLELESPATGTLIKVLYAEGATVPVYEDIAVIALTGETVEEIPENTAARGEAEDDGFVRATPVAKRLAKEHGIKLSGLSGSGPGGRIKEEDVLNYLESMKTETKTVDKIITSSAAAGEEVVLPLTGAQKILAANVRNSHDTAVHVTSTTEVDLTGLIELRKRLTPAWEKDGVHLTLNAFFVRAVAMALKKHPMLNASLAADSVVIKKYYHIGLAVSLVDTIIVPVIRDADKLTVKQIAGQIRLLADKARAGRLSRDDVTGGTFTISNVGLYQVQIFTPVIIPPQGAILGIGAAVKRPVFIGEEIAARYMANLCLTYDHRFIQGVPAAEFRLTIKGLLEEPEMLLS